LAAAGCGPSARTVSGTVTYEGTPIPSGQISFAPEDSGVGGSGTIVNGHYTVTLAPGRCKVLVTATKLVKLPEGEKGMYGKTEEMRNYVPARYNTDTELKADITSSITLDFNLKSDAASK
jgi:hypothetical protein